MESLDKALIILACTLAFLLIGSLGAAILSERFMAGSTGVLTIILGTCSTVFTALAGGAYFARDMKKARDDEHEQVNRESREGR